MSGRVGIVAARRGVIYGSTRAKKTSPLPAGSSGDRQVTRSRGRERFWLGGGFIPGIFEEWHIVRLMKSAIAPLPKVL